MIPLIPDLAHIIEMRYIHSLNRKRAANQHIENENFSNIQLRVERILI